MISWPLLEIKLPLDNHDRFQLPNIYILPDTKLQIYSNLMLLDHDVEETLNQINSTLKMEMGPETANLVHLLYQVK